MPFTESEIREVLTATLQHLQTQMFYVQNLHQQMSVLLAALNQTVPKFEQSHKIASETPEILGLALQQSQIADIGVLLHRLRTS